MSTMKLYHYAKFHADWPEISVPRKKYKSFLIGDSPVGYLPMLHILGSSHQANVMPHLTHNAATYRFPDICGQNLGFGILGPIG